MSSSTMQDACGTVALGSVRRAQQECPSSCCGAGSIVGSRAGAGCGAGPVDRRRP